jgi:hypothetical protein
MPVCVLGARGSQSKNPGLHSCRDSAGCHTQYIIQAAQLPAVSTEPAEPGSHAAAQKCSAPLLLLLHLLLQARLGGRQSGVQLLVLKVRIMQLGLAPGIEPLQAEQAGLELCVGQVLGRQLALHRRQAGVELSVLQLQARCGDLQPVHPLLQHPSSRLCGSPGLSVDLPLG